MKYVKIYEEFVAEDAEAVMMNPGHPSNSAPKVYMYHIHKDADGEDFRATVRDQDGKVIYEIKGDGIFNNDGGMKDKTDIGGLQRMLVSKNKIRPEDSVVTSDDYTEVVAQTPEFNTNQM